MKNKSRELERLFLRNEYNIKRLFVKEPDYAIFYIIFKKNSLESRRPFIEFALSLLDDCPWFVRFEFINKSILKDLVNLREITKNICTELEHKNALDYLRTHKGQCLTIRCFLSEIKYSNLIEPCLMLYFNGKENDSDMDAIYNEIYEMEHYLGIDIVFYSKGEACPTDTVKFDITYY